MKIAITARRAGLDAPLEPRFARCKCYVIVDSESLRYEVLGNPMHIPGKPKTGVGSAAQLAHRGVDAVATGNLGVAAHQILLEGGVTVYGGVHGTVRDVMNDLACGRLKRLSLEGRPPRSPGLTGRRTRTDCPRISPVSKRHKRGSHRA